MNDLVMKKQILSIREHYGFEDLRLKTTKLPNRSQ